MVDLKMPAEMVTDTQLKSGNIFLRMHWAARARYKETWMAAVGFHWHRQSKKPDVRRMVTIVSHRRKILDDDNLRTGCKPLVDVLVELNLLRDDSPEWVKVFYVQHTISHNPEDKPYTQITIDDYHGSKFHTI